MKFIQIIKEGLNKDSVIKVIDKYILNQDQLLSEIDHTYDPITQTINMKLLNQIIVNKDKLERWKLNIIKINNFSQDFKLPFHNIDKLTKIVKIIAKFYMTISQLLNFIEKTQTTLDDNIQPLKDSRYWIENEIRSLSY